ncbi:glycosyltransferase family 2 protein [Herbiconiux sp. YIM B11900]|uniref:glycosyltransferase family 2 protein n=1 Tax=Herbiconiux sp. YIM B11900 TaxID=3404131 RepID=UPI003F8623B0
MTVSVVIPVKDDAARLAICLDALARQSWPPLEIIVVDNGSSDASAAVARAGGARVVVESRAGIPAASSCGYDSAIGDVIARLDADSIVSADWVETVARRFAERPDVGCITGGASFSGGPVWLRRIGAVLYLGAYYAALAPALGHVPLFGSNFAMRRDVWESARWTVHRTDSELHDDLDLSYHLGPRVRVRLVRGLSVQISHRPFTDPASMLRRFRRGFRTVAVHWPRELPWLRWARAIRARWHSRRSGETKALPLGARHEQRILSRARGRHVVAVGLSMTDDTTPDIQWNDEARAKILDDADGVLREAVLSTARSHQDADAAPDSDEVYAELNAKLKDRFIDYEPGPDVRKYADAIVAGEFSGR